MKNVPKPLANGVLIPLGLTAAASAADAAIHKKIFRSGRGLSELASCNAILIISNEEIKYIWKTIKSIEESGLLIKGVCETIEKEKKEPKEGFLLLLLDTLGPSILGNLLTGKDAIRAGGGAIATSQEQGTIRAVEGTIRAGQYF